MDGTDPRWGWWTDAAEQLAKQLGSLKRPKPDDSWELVGRRIAKWLGRLHQNGLWIRIHAVGAASVETTIRTSLDPERALEELVVRTKYDLADERCSWAVELRTEPPHATGALPAGADKSRMRAAARTIAGRSIEETRNPDAEPAWDVNALYFHSPAETMVCKERLIEALKAAQRWSKSHGTIAGLVAALHERHAALRAEHDHHGGLSRLTITGPVSVPSPQAMLRNDSEWAGLTVAKVGGDRWRLATEGPGRLIEAAIQADRNSRMTLPRVNAILTAIALHPDMQKTPEVPAPPLPRRAAPTAATRWFNARGPMSEKESRRRRLQTGATGSTAPSPRALP